MKISSASELNRFTICLVLIIGLCAESTSAQWTRDLKNFEGGIIESFSSRGDTVLVGTRHGGCFVSTDAGLSWQQRNNGIDIHNIVSVSIGEAGCFASSFWSNKMYYSSDAGLHWTTRSSGLDPSLNVFHMFQIKGRCIATGAKGNVWISDNSGKSWISTLAVVGSTSEIRAHAQIDSTLFVVVQDNGLFSSTDNGRSWKLVNADLQTIKRGRDITSMGTSLYACTGNGDVLRSSDKGLNWTRQSVALNNSTPLCMQSYGTTLFVGTIRRGLQYSTDEGLNWAQCTNGMTETGFQAMDVVGNTLLAAGFGGVSRSTDGGKRWSPANTGLQQILPMWGLEVHKDFLFVATSSNGLYRRAKGDSIWQPASITMPRTKIYALRSDATQIVAGTNAGGMFRSTDAGLTWADISIPDEEGLIESICLHETTMIASSENGVTYISSNNGSTWSTLDLLGSGSPVYYAATTSTDAYLATSSNIYRYNYSTKEIEDLGNSVLPGTYCYAMYAHGNQVCIANSSGVYVSTDGGKQWEYNSIFTTTDNIGALYCTDAYIVVGTANGDVWRSMNKGISWDRVGTDIGLDQSLSGAYKGIVAFAEFDKLLFAATFQLSVLHHNLEELVSVRDDSKYLSTSSLELTTYPNPAEHSICISYTSRSDGNERITISTLNGEVLLESNMYIPAGLQTQRLELGTLANGCYILEVQNGSQRQSKMVYVMR